MNRNIASALSMGAITAAAIAAAIVSGSAYADDITVDNTRFVSTRSRAEVQAELMSPTVLGRTEWARQYNQLPQIKTSDLTSEQVKAEYKASRDVVKALTAEDSGSMFLIKSASLRVPAGSATMGGPAH